MNFIKLKVWLKIIKGLTLNIRTLTNYNYSNFLSDRQTLLYLKEHQIGIVRFGDGESGYLSGYSFSHQKQNPILREKLINILKIYKNNHSFLIALPYEIFFNRHQERNLSKKGWKTARYSLLPYLKNQCVYGSAFCFRIPFVIDENKKEYTSILFSLILNKDIIYVGSGEPYPDLISPKCVIKTPATDAFDEYQNLMENVQKIVKEFKNPCVLLSCGITATALSADLNNRGILSYDVGLCFTRRLSNFKESS